MHRHAYGERYHSTKTYVGHVFNDQSKYLVFFQNVITGASSVTVSAVTVPILYYDSSLRMYYEFYGLYS